MAVCLCSPFHTVIKFLVIISYVIFNHNLLVLMCDVHTFYLTISSPHYQPDSPALSDSRPPGPLLQYLSFVHHILENCCQELCLELSRVLEFIFFVTMFVS